MTLMQALGFPKPTTSALKLKAMEVLPLATTIKSSRIGSRMAAKIRGPDSSYWMPSTSIIDE